MTATVHIVYGVCGVCIPKGDRGENRSIWGMHTREIARWLRQCISCLGYAGYAYPRLGGAEDKKYMGYAYPRDG